MSTKTGTPASGGKGTAGRRYHVRWVRDLSVLESIQREWDELADRALERSPSSEAWMLLPAMRELADGAEVGALLIYAVDQKDGDKSPQLLGVFPLELVKGYKGLPVRLLRSWNHCYSLFPAPLLSAEHAADCLREFFRWARDEWPGTALVEFPDLRADSAFFRLLSDVLREDDLVCLASEVHTRAFFRPRRAADEYLGSVSTAHHRHELRRQERRLAESGELQFGSVPAGAPVEAWLEEFIALEMAGWKGKEGTAFGSKEHHRAFLLDVAGAAARRGELMLLDLRLGGKAVAMKLNFICGDGGYTFKIAFDEGYAKYSPGTLLELENIRRAHANPAIRWLDSLALPDHSMMNRVWLDRTAVVSQLVSPGRFAGQLLLGLVPLLRVLKRRIGSRV